MPDTDRNRRFHRSSVDTYDPHLTLISDLEGVILVRDKLYFGVCEPAEVLFGREHVF